MSIRFSALTVREGDAFLLEDNGWNCLFDSGKDKTIVDLLKFKGIDKLDLAICSHNDADHANGFIALFNNGFKIHEIWLPGFWAAVLLFVADNCCNVGKVKWDYRDYNGELDSLFSNKSVSDEAFDQVLSFLEEIKDSNAIRGFCDRLHGELALRTAEDNNTIGYLLDSIPTKHLYEDYLDDDLGVVFEDYYPWAFWAHLIDHEGDDYPPKRILRELLHHGPEWTQHKIKSSLDFKLKKIISIATLAKMHGCTIRWFEPSLLCTKKELDYGFVSLNSSQMCRIGLPKNSVAYMCLLSLTKENKYSLVFEYTKNNVPIIRFSADSDCTCQSVSPYDESIIVTAPHHGSSANAEVYKTIKGNNLIWVRSDKQSNKRPCIEFKNRKDKYCLACKKFSFISEICFEYRIGLKRWDYVRGEQCRCE